MIRPPPPSTLFPYTTLFRSLPILAALTLGAAACAKTGRGEASGDQRSEEHTSNSSHVSISYAVFCLKKKNETKSRHIKQIIGLGRGDRLRRTLRESFPGFSV